MTKIAAEKARDSLASGLYDKIFDQLIKIINKHLSPSSDDDSVGILDIAGFGELIFTPHIAIYMNTQQIGSEENSGADVLLALWICWHTYRPVYVLHTNRVSIQTYVCLCIHAPNGQSQICANLHGHIDEMCYSL